MTTTKTRSRKIYPCKNNCGNMVHKKNRTCIDCYRKVLAQGKRQEYINNNEPRKRYPSDDINYRKNHIKPTKLYPCKNNCGNKTKVSGSLCLSCREKNLRLIADKRDADKKQRQEANQRKMLGRLKPVEIELCTSLNNTNPKKAHEWVIDSDNVGECKFCRQKRDFMELLQPYRERLNI